MNGGVVEGFDIRNGAPGVLVERTTAPGPLVRGNWIHDNHPPGGIYAGGPDGGVVRVIGNRIHGNSSAWCCPAVFLLLTSAASTLEANEIFDNHVTTPGDTVGTTIIAGEARVADNVIACNSGGGSALVVRGLVENNTVVANFSHTLKPAVRAQGGEDDLCTLRGNNIAYNVGPGLDCYQPLIPPFTTFEVDCNNFFNNGPGGQVSGACAGAVGQRGNISVEPEFGRAWACPSGPGDWCLGPDSPLLPVYTPPDCGLIGAVAECPPTGNAAEAPAAAPLRALAPRPNPFSARTAIAFHLADEADVEVAIRDVLGRSVRRLHAGRLAAGDHEIVWDGRAESGVPAASGAYVAVIRAGARGEVTRTLLLVK